MNIQVSARAFKSVAEQRAHAAEVHKRLMTATKPRDLEKAKARITGHAINNASALVPCCRRRRVKHIAARPTATAGTASVR